MTRPDACGPHDLNHLPPGIVVAEEYQAAPLKSPPDRFGPRQDDAIIVKAIVEARMRALVLAQRVESGCPQVPAQFSKGGIRGETHHSPHEDNGGKVKSPSSKRTLTV
jgi:hypothetical protein